MEEGTTKCIPDDKPCISNSNGQNKWNVAQTPYCLICEGVTNILVDKRHGDDEHAQSKADEKNSVDQVHHQPR